MNTLLPLSSKPLLNLSARQPKTNPQIGSFTWAGVVTADMPKHSVVDMLISKNEMLWQQRACDLAPKNLSQTVESLYIFHGGNPWTLKPKKTLLNVNVFESNPDSLGRSVKLEYVGFNNFGATFSDEAQTYNPAAEFELVGWLFQSIDGVIEELADNEAYLEANDDQYAKIRKDLQNWFAASVDDLARILDISPTTVVNLSKPGRSVRTKTVRKLRGMHGLLSELQRAIGQQAALSWSQSVGRRMLLAGDMQGFEQFVNTRIFPTADRKLTLKMPANVDETDLVLAKQPYVGRASRF